MRNRGRFGLVLIAAALSLSLMATGVATAKSTHLSASLSGDNETSGGDPDGSGTADITLKPKKKRVCWDLTWENIATPTAAHIHKGKAGVDGDIVVPLFVTDQTGGEASGCATGVKKKLIKKIKKKPRSYYVNVHNADFPPGAIRGQLHK